MLCPALDCGTQNWDRILHALPNPFGFKSLTVSICISVGGLWQALELLTCCCLSSWCSSQSLPTGIGWGLALATCGYQMLLSHLALSRLQSCSACLRGIGSFWLALVTIGQIMWLIDNMRAGRKAILRALPVVAMRLPAVCRSGQQCLAALKATVTNWYY